jgi:hypothetical protein
MKKRRRHGPVCVDMVQSYPQNLSALAFDDRLEGLPLPALHRNPAWASVVEIAFRDDGYHWPFRAFAGTTSAFDFIALSTFAANVLSV